MNGQGHARSDATVAGDCGTIRDQLAAQVDALVAMAKERVGASIAEAVLAPATGSGPAIACTLAGGVEAMRGRVADWQHVS